ncbi:hypothetical protein CerSpe_273520 [Prunus speciosa]
MASQDGLDHGDFESRQNASSREQERASEGAFTLTDLITAIQAMGETQREMMDTIKELKGSISKPTEENGHPQEESAAAAGKGSEQKGPSFVTQEDVVAMLERELNRSQEDWKYIPQPPYPSSLLQQPYPKGYEAPSFVLFYGRKGSPKEHVNRFIDALGPHVGDYNLRLREFSKSLTDRAYTWYTTLAPGSIRSWEDLASRFCKKYFQHEERVTTTQLNNTRQKHGEDPVDFVRRFRDLALDCYDEKDEEALVEICISNIVADYRVYLENIGISQFSRLLEAVRKTSMSVKPAEQRSWRSEKKEMHQTLAVDDKSSGDYNSRKRKDRETYPLLPCKDEEFHAILDTMIADGAIKPLRPYKIPTREEKNDPRYCRYHQFVGHPTTACQSLRRILHAKIHEGVLELPSRKQTIDEDPLPKRRGKEIAAVITCSGDLLDDDELCHPWKNDPKPPEAIWEPCGNMEKAYWCKYSKPSSYNTPWPLADGWDDGAGGEVSPMDVLEECYLGASQQETAAVTFHNLTEAETSVMERYLGLKQGPIASQVLQRNPKFKSLFDQLCFGPQAREAAAVALMNISAGSDPHCFTTQPQRPFLGNDNAIVFTDEDMEVPYPDHRRPLYLEGQINDVFIRRALVDTGSSVNILPLSVLTAAGIPLSKIVQSQTSISGFENKSEVTVGYMQVNLKVGPIRSLTKFYVVDVDVAYHALLGRPWLNKHKLVVSTYHQCVKGRIGLRPLHIPGNQAPFNKNEAHYSEAEFYTECIGAGSSPSKDFGTYLPSWTEIRDLSNEELITIVDQERKRHSEVNNHAYDRPQCSKVTLPDGRTVYRL